MPDLYYNLIPAFFLGIIGMSTPALVDKLRNYLCEKDWCEYPKGNSSKFWRRWYSSKLAFASLATISLSALGSIFIIIARRHPLVLEIKIGLLVVLFFIYWIVYMAIIASTMVEVRLHWFSKILCFVFCIVPVALVVYASAYYLTNY